MKKWGQYTFTILVQTRQRLLSFPIPQDRLCALRSALHISLRLGPKQNFLSHISVPLHITHSWIKDHESWFAHTYAVNEPIKHFALLCSKEPSRVNTTVGWAKEGFRPSIMTCVSSKYLISFHLHLLPLKVKRSVSILFLSILLLFCSISCKCHIPCYVMYLCNDSHKVLFSLIMK